MILINTYLKNNRNGRTYICNVYYIYNNTIEDITELFKNNFNYKNNCLYISFGSGTGYNKLKQFLKENTEFIKKNGLDNKQIINNSLDI